MLPASPPQGGTKRGPGPPGPLDVTHCRTALRAGRERAGVGHRGSGRTRVVEVDLVLESLRVEHFHAVEAIGRRGGEDPIPAVQGTGVERLAHHHPVFRAEKPEHTRDCTAVDTCHTAYRWKRATPDPQI